MTITLSSTAGPCAVGTVVTLAAPGVPTSVGRVTAAPVGAAPPSKGSRDLLQGSAWVNNLAVAKYATREPRSRRTRTAVKVAAP